MNTTKEASLAFFHWHLGLGNLLGLIWSCDQKQEQILTHIIKVRGYKQKHM